MRTKIVHPASSVANPDWNTATRSVRHVFGSDTLCHQAAPLIGGGHAMPKEIKGNARRKPPEPSANHSDIDDWFRRQMPHLQPIVQALDEAIPSDNPGPSLRPHVQAAALLATRTW